MPDTPTSLLDILRSLEKQRVQLWRRRWSHVEAQDALADLLSADLGARASLRRQAAANVRIARANQPPTEEDEEAYYDQPLFWFCARLEEVSGISRYDLERVAYRLRTAIGLQPHRKQKRPGEEPEEWPDWRWMFERFNALDANGTTARLLAELVDQFNDELPAELRALRRSGKTTKARRRSKRGKPGRRPDTDAKADRKIADRWRSRQYRTYEALAKELGRTTEDVRLAVDRDRKRRAPE